MWEKQWHNYGYSWTNRKIWIFLPKIIVVYLQKKKSWIDTVWSFPPRKVLPKEKKKAKPLPPQKKTQKPTGDSTQWQIFSHDVISCPIH